MNASGGSHPRKEESALHVSAAQQERGGVLITKTISQHTYDTQLKTVSEKGGASL